MKNRIVVISVSVFFLAMSLWGILWKTPDYSQSERRVLASFPDVSAESILNGEFSKGFDEYAVERFPARDLWRRIKAYTKTGIFQQSDNNKIYTVGRHISKMEYPVNQSSLDYAAALFTRVRETYLTDQKVYLAVIPDKNKYLAEENGYLEMDYDGLSAYMAEKMPFAEYIEISDLLEADDYYYTDSHWRQPAITDVAQRIAAAMGADITADYTTCELDMPFNGVYVGQSALDCEPDTITYLESETLKQAQVEGAKGIYDEEKGKGKDPYEFFLSGNQPVITVKNSLCDNGKRLILFRDSFGSSIAPLFVEGYEEVVLVDLRYLPSHMLAEYVDFENADVLFLYSAMILNNARSMK